MKVLYAWYCRKLMVFCLLMVLVFPFLEENSVLRLTGSSTGKTGILLSFHQVTLPRDAMNERMKRTIRNDTRHKTEEICNKSGSSKYHFFFPQQQILLTTKDKLPRTPKMLRTITYYIIKQECVCWLWLISISYLCYIWSVIHAAVIRDKPIQSQACQHVRWIILLSCLSRILGNKYIFWFRHPAGSLNIFQIKLSYLTVIIIFNVYKCWYLYIKNFK